MRGMELIDSVGWSGVDVAERDTQPDVTGWEHWRVMEANVIHRCLCPSQELQLLLKAIHGTVDI